ncbi:HAD-IIB family hydrolase [Bacillus smithii]|uniref:HAD-IIB family hydrolase n=1 Tax=Bacillus smithii TaxID=1479 RepID=UPI003D1DF60B
MNFVFDLDGTICFQGKPVSEKILECLDDLKKNGHEFIFASARPIRDMMPVLPKRFHTATLIGGNGSLISKEGKLIYSQAFTDEQIQIILDLIEEHQAAYLIDSEWDYAYTGPSDHPILQNLDVDHLAKSLPVESLSSIVKVLILTADDIEGLTKKLRSLDIVIHRHHHENTIDLSPKNIDKWSALKLLGFDKKTYVAFGNDSNDLTMFKNASYSVMIGHHEELAAFAKEQIPFDENCERNIIARIKEIANIRDTSIFSP